MITKESVMRDFDFRFGPVSGYFSTRPETNMVGVLVERRGRSFTLHLGLLLVEIMGTIDFGLPRGALRR